MNDAIGIAAIEYRKAQKVASDANDAVMRLHDSLIQKMRGRFWHCGGGAVVIGSGPHLIVRYKRTECGNEQITFEDIA